MATIELLYAGGPGSGCNPDKGKCGRPLSRAGTGTKELVRRYAASGMQDFRSTIIYDLDLENLEINVFRGKEWIGTVQIEPLQRGKVWRIAGVFVKNSLVGKGYGKFLYKTTLRRAVERGVEVVRSSLKDNRTRGSENSWKRLRRRLPVVSKAMGDDQYWELKLA